MLVWLKCVFLGISLALYVVLAKYCFSNATSVFVELEVSTSKGFYTNKVSI